MKKSIIAAIVVVSILAVGLSITASFSFAAGSPPHRTFVATLSAAPGVTTSATGEATFQLSPNGQSLSYTLVVSNINNVFMAHIHFKDGSIIVWLYPNPSVIGASGQAPCLAVATSAGSPTLCSSLISGTFSGVLASGTLTPKSLSSSECYGCNGFTFSELISQIESGNTFVNVHTVANPGGELQGTIESATSAPHPQSHLSFQFQSSLAGSTPSTPIDGIASGAAPWVVMPSHARILSNGLLSADVDGLLISLPGSPLDGTTGPVTSVFASLVCQNTNGVTIISTGAVPFSSNGNANINQNIPLPNTCFAPTVLIRIAGTTTSPRPSFNGPWIAATGFSNS